MVPDPKEAASVFQKEPSLSRSRSSFSGRSRENKEGEGKRRRVPTWVFIVAILAGLALIVYPSFSDWWNRQHQTRAIAGYVKTTNNMPQKSREEIWQEAVDYNTALAKDPTGFILTDAEEEEYEKTLDVTGTGIMGYVTIPSIDVYLPIYHGTDPAVLQIAAGHIAGSSLPVGGESTHCVITGHTGLPSARLFTGLNKLEKGDHFMLETLDQTLTYEVDQVKTVLPAEVDDLQIVRGKDLCTLVTCTPYGINTHRLLVRGHRVPNEEKEYRTAQEEAVKMNYLPVVLFILGVLLVAGCVVILVRRGMEKRRGRKS